MITQVGQNRSSNERVPFEIQLNGISCLSFDMFPLLALLQTEPFAIKFLLSTKKRQNARLNFPLNSFLASRWR